MLVLNNCSIGYDKQVILEDVSLTVNPNEIVGIMGGNGSGKTTLLKSICSIINLISGEYLLNNRHISTYSIKDRAKMISYLPQKSGIVNSIDVIDVVLMGVTPYMSIFQTPSQADRKQAENLLEQASILELKDKNFLELSEGQKQLVLIAKSLMQKSSIMIFDEPSASLDFNNTYLFMDNITRAIMQNNKSAIITIHDPNLALLYCDKIIALKDGRIIDTIIMKDATHENIVETFSALYYNITLKEHNGKFYVIKENS